jgi:redox-sensitive bicupin YhaK (pirin superfamily)
VTIHQDAYVYAGLFDGHQRAEHGLRDGRRAYVHIVRGEVDINGKRLEGGDAAKLTDVSAVKIENGSNAEVLLFDLP